MGSTLSAAVESCIPLSTASGDIGACSCAWHGDPTVCDLTQAALPSRAELKQGLVAYPCLADGGGGRACRAYLKVAGARSDCGSPEEIRHKSSQMRGAYARRRRNRCDARQS